MMDGSFFAFALIGALVGFIVGDFQRERRLRREARAGAALAKQRANERAQQRANAVRTVTGTDDNGDGPAVTLDSYRRAAGRRAVRGDNYRTGPVSAAPGRYLRGADASPVMAGGVDFDGD